MSMAHTARPIRIGSVKITPEELEALRIRRDYKRLREAAGWSSSLNHKEASVLKDLLGEDVVSERRNERAARQRQVTRPSFTRYGY